ncbi:hypothetical protein GW17_00052576 [Ensete ventricosum]|nr:hypothetical protein GW17_00052576 [Ensete ventricosum]
MLCFRSEGSEEGGSHLRVRPLLGRPPMTMVASCRGDACEHRQRPPSRYGVLPKGSDACRRGGRERAQPCRLHKGNSDNR